MKLLAWLVFPWVLFATVNEPTRLKFLTGYRNDLIHWHLTQGETFFSGERTRNIQFFENALSLQVVHRDIAFYAGGGYGAFGQGELKEQIGNLPFINEIPTVNFSTYGWTLDGSTNVGYAINLTPDRTYRVILIPLAGFSGHYEIMERPGTSTLETSSYAISVNFPKNYQQTWYGPYIGGKFQIEPGSGLLFKAGYAYHWLHLRVSNQITQQIINPFTESVTNKFTLNRWDNFGHSGLVEMEFSIDRLWHIGATVQLNYYFSGNHPVNVAQQSNSVSNPIKETFKLRWISICGLITLSRSI